MQSTLAGYTGYTYFGGKKSTGELGFEPRQADPESAVLPLHHSPKVAGNSISVAAAILHKFPAACQICPCAPHRGLPLGKTPGQS
jgi:hypothetical protein